MSAPLALDTSVAVPLLVATHNDHAAVTSWWANRTVALAGHALAETYSVLTRLPGDVRLSGADAARLLAARFAPPLILSAKTGRRLPELLSRAGIVGVRSTTPSWPSPRSSTAPSWPPGMPGHATRTSASARSSSLQGLRRGSPVRARRRRGPTVTGSVRGPGDGGYLNPSRT